LHGSETVDGQARRPGQGKDEAAADPQRLQRLNQLVQAPQRIQGDRESRACLFIRSEQARLAGDPETSRSLSQRAESLTWQDDDTESYLEAIRLFTLRDYPQARDILTTLADRGTIPTALRWTTLGRSQYHQGQYEDAKLSFTQSIERAPHASRLWKLRGLCYYKTREYARAAEDFSQAIKLEPTLYSAWSDRGLCKEAMRDLSGALDDYNAVLQRHPENVHALILRSRAQRKAGKDEAADRDFRAALTVENPSPAAIVIRAHERFQQGDFAGALADFEQALQQDRGNSMLLQNVAMVLSKQKRYPEAISRLGEAIEVAPWKEKAVINRALLLARIGRYEEARQDLRRAIRPPNDPEVLYQAGCVNALFPGEQTTPIALAFLSKAIQAGFDADLKNDKDLDAIRETKGFQSLVETIELGHRLRRKKSSPTAIPQPNGPPDLDE
jgi:tetratricopeptide (TPR) repeat protein